jgi:hypothetical protein
MSTLTVKGISLNLSRPFDTGRLMSLSHQPHKNPMEVESWYVDKIQAAFKGGELHTEAVDFFCFQEFYPDDAEKKELVEILSKAGFTIIGNGDLGIAFKTHKFVMESSGYTSPDSNGALYALLKHKMSEQTLCVVTDHVRGFDARLQKTFTRAIKAGSENNPITGNPWKEGEKQAATAPGDQAIANSLKFLNQKLSPSLFVVGLDANATARYLPTRVHPKRMDQFFQDRWVCDEKDVNPTVIDHFLEPEYMQKDTVPAYTKMEPFHPAPTVAVKYDYVCAKAPWGHALTITSKVLGPTPDQFKMLISDHCPVLATIELKRTWTSIGWSIYKFFRFLNPISLFVALFSYIFSGKKEVKMDFTAFDKHLIDNPNYLYLKKEGKYLGLLIAADITPEELLLNFNALGTPLATLLAEKNKNTPYQDTPAQICEFFVVSCALKKLRIKHMAVKNFVGYAKSLIESLKDGIKALSKKQSPSPQEVKIKQYIQDHMKDATLLPEVSVVSKTEQ